MTMAKSLVTVTVDNVFRNFLIDEERYELLDSVELMLDVASDGNALVVPPLKNERIRVFLEGTLENVVLGAAAVVRVYLADWSEKVPQITRDRARRFRASLNCADLVWIDTDLSARQNVRELSIALWANFFEAFRVEHVKLGAKFGSKDPYVIQHQQSNVP